MTYNFKKVQEAINQRGLTLAEVSDLTLGHLPDPNRKVHYTTIGAALKRGTAHQPTARALVAALGLSMDDILIKAEAA